MIEIGGARYGRMADSIDPHALPAGMDAYLGYVDGAWPDYLDIAKAHGNVPVYGLTVRESGVAGAGTDTEPGDGTIAEAVQATKIELARGVERPIKYCPESWAGQLVAAHIAGGVPRQLYRLLTAHYGRGQHICGPRTCGCPVQADGTQWIDHGTWDESLLDPSFLDPSPHPGPAPASKPAPPPVQPADLPVPIKEESMPYPLVVNGQLVIAATAKDNNDLLVFRQELDGKWTVEDVTVGIHDANPADSRKYQVQ